MESMQELKPVVHIPEEIVDNILARLPVKSLARFKTVSKAWCSSITNPNFQRRNQHSVLSVGKSSQAKFYHSIREQEKPSVEAFPVFWDNRDQFSRAYVSNSCHGLVLVCVGISFYLFNPSTHYSVKVLTLNYLDDDHEYDTLYSRSSDDKCYKLYIGLYYDETISDYKAVVVITHGVLKFRDDTISCTGILVEASLKEKRWNHLNHTFDSNYYDITVGPIVNGRLHWLVNKKLTRFDPVLKVFEELPSFQPPQNHTKYYGMTTGIGILEGCLCVSRFINENTVEILAMKEYGVSESWTPIFSFSAERLYLCDPLVLPRAGELFVSRLDELWVYHVGKRTFKEYSLPNEGISTCASVSFVPNMYTPNGYYWNQMEHEKFGNTEDFERIKEFWKEIALVRSQSENGRRGLFNLFM